VGGICGKISPEADFAWKGVQELNGGGAGARERGSAHIQERWLLSGGKRREVWWYIVLFWGVGKALGDGCGDLGSVAEAGSVFLRGWNAGQALR